MLKSCRCRFRWGLIYMFVFDLMLWSGYDRRTCWFWTSWVDTFLWCALGNTRYLCVDSLKPWNIVFSRA
ncbi:hypothetical protein BDV27DRAFT_131343 [Aspergillus caelatus]|uniref:Uncharacterized protein n=1 Tax=Aspergillus caelatus TaxID=61420 RepID=A0A5N6ZYT9_9EURO|nr:uncharacterized protein BDV27DRAFT_131343 [Aspergillus caelatus]KAE8362518.1 hypothetical protein BDV27DRAFT_131343 [Aspergillus caelatus]